MRDASSSDNLIIVYVDVSFTRCVSVFFSDLVAGQQAALRFSSAQPKLLRTSFSLPS